MPEGSKAKRVALLIVAVLVVVVGAGVPAGVWVHHRRLNALFEGPFQEQHETRSGYYAVAIYDLKDYLPDQVTKPDNGLKPSLLDKPEKPKEEWERSIEVSHPDYRLDISTGATKAARLISPTTYRAPWVPRVLTITYPPEGAAFPPNLCAPTIEWSDIHNDFWQVTLTVPSKKEDSPLFSWGGLSESRRRRIPDDVWRKIKDLATGASVTVRVKGVRRSGLWGKISQDIHASKVVTFHISSDRCDNAVVYRLVAPPAIMEKTPGLFVRDIREREPRPFLDARYQYCVNCHTFASKTGSHGKMSLQVRYIGKGTPKGHRVYLAVYDIDRRSGRKAILPFEKQMSTFMRWSPDGTKLALSAQQEVGGYAPVTYETQSIGQPTSDIAVYDTADDTAVLVPGASEPDLLELFPCWTPDGKSIVFATAKPKLHPSQTQYELKIIPYDDGRGGTPRFVRGASQNGKSNFYPQFSPDGKWFTFVKADYGALIKSSSDIYIAPASLDADPRLLASNVDYAADSWHSWSSNSRWLLFASKRDDGIFARVYFTHIDEEGNATPAVRLPIEDPALRMTFNIPEFVADVPPIEEVRLYSQVGVESKEFNVPAPRVPPGRAGTTQTHVP